MPGQTMSWEWYITPYPADWNHCDDKDKLFVDVYAKALCCECSSAARSERLGQDKARMTVGLYDPITLIVDKIYLGTQRPGDSNRGFVTDNTVDSRPKPGQTVYYKIVVYNKGCLPLSCIEVTDSLIGYVGCIPCLLPCEQKAIRGIAIRYRVTGPTARMASTL